jgi:hypothetical protein
MVGRRGARVLIQAYRLPDGRLTAGICGFTRPIEGNEALIDYVKSFEGPATQTRLIGSIRMSNGHEFEPVEGRPVTIIGPRTFTVSTDVNGDFVVSDLPPGTYRVEPDIRPAPWQRPVQFTWQATDAYACEEAKFIAPPDGRISGTVVNLDGRAMTGVLVPLRPVDEKDAASGSRGTRARLTDEAGRFEFDELPPGSYVIGNVSIEQTITLRPGEHLNIGPLKQRH